jgi:hypothetical protein
MITTPKPPRAQALELYRRLLSAPDPDPQHHTYAAACLFHMGEFEAAEEEALQGPRSQLQVRVCLELPWTPSSAQSAHALHCP